MNLRSWPVLARQVSRDMPVYAVTVWEKPAVFMERVKRNTLYVKNYFGYPACDFQLVLVDTKYGNDVDSLTHINYDIT